MRHRVERPKPWWMIPFLLLSLASLAATSSDLHLVEAVERGDRETVLSQLEQNADVNAAQADGTTALHWAAHRDDLETAELLVGAEADVNTANHYGVTPLSLACTNGSVSMVQKLLKAGATIAISETLEASLQLGGAVLSTMGFIEEDATALIESLFVSP